MPFTEKNFESDIESFLISPEGGYKKGTGIYDKKYAVWAETLLDFVKATQEKQWKRFSALNTSDPEKKFLSAFDNAVSAQGMLVVIRNGFKTLIGGVHFKVCYFKPESELNILDAQNYHQNIIEVHRQWFYSDSNNKSVDMVLTVNGIPLFAFELKNQLTGQSIYDAQLQWQNDRSNKEKCFAFNGRILGFFCIDLYECSMATKLENSEMRFLPFNQGSNGAGHDGGQGNPHNPNGYDTSYVWEKVFQKDSMMDILQKFISLSVEKDKKTGKETPSLIFPRYHQLDVVKDIINFVKTEGVGKNYLVQHSAGSGKSNSIAWTAYRLASLFDSNGNPVFRSVIVITDRRVLDSQLQETITGFEHKPGYVVPITDEEKSVGLRDAINNGARIIITTLQKFPVIYKEIDDTTNKNFAVIVDEAHSSQTGDSAIKLKTALADTEEMLRQYAELEDRAEDELDFEHDRRLQELVAQGTHKNLSFFAFTATPKDKTIALFGKKVRDGENVRFVPHHIYSMRQAISENFILDVLQNYTTYETCYEILNKTDKNPELSVGGAVRAIQSFKNAHPYNIAEKSKIILDTFKTVTENKIGGKGKMMVVTASRLAAVRYTQELKAQIKSRSEADSSYNSIQVLTAFSGKVTDGDTEYSEPSLNVRLDGTHIKESQTKDEFHDNFNVLVVAEKFQTGFDEPLLHTMVIDKKLKGVKAVQTLSRLNRTCKNKEDTFILDFANTAEQIKEAFQPFYQETELEGEMNIDLVLHALEEVHSYNLYSTEDVKEFAGIFYSNDKKQKDRNGLLAGTFKAALEKYHAEDEDKKYQIRRSIRKFVKWYGFVTQLVALMNEDLQNEFQYCVQLLKVLSVKSPSMQQIQNMLELEKYKLEKTSSGKIALENEDGVFTPSNKTSGKGKIPQEPLDEILEALNEQYRGKLTEADKVIINQLAKKIDTNEKLIQQALAADPKILEDSIFPQEFLTMVSECYQESEEGFSKMFEDKSYYKIMTDVMFRYFCKRMASVRKGAEKK